MTKNYLFDKDSYAESLRRQQGKPTFNGGTRYYKEVDCRVCDGKGKRELRVSNIFEHTWLDTLCEACMGRGTQTVLEREEV